ncbi:MAG TPA: Hsp20/alpha crystallin family protein [Candidatus Rubrimentiphilum sp.]|nr:Hsp20/alpha crystallin family protein [Candidatus Rubrimentiphilum sp.]
MALLEQKKDVDTQFTALVERMFDDFPFAEFQLPRFAYALPPLNLYDEFGKYILELAVPGFEPKEINVEVTGSTVVISGFRSSADEKKFTHYHRREIRLGSFARTVALPQDVDPERVIATVEKGILTITLWPMKSIVPKKVEVKAA